MVIHLLGHMRPKKIPVVFSYLKKLGSVGKEKNSFYVIFSGFSRFVTIHGHMISSQPPGENRVAWSIILKNNWVSRKERVGREPEPQVCGLRTLVAIMHCRGIIS